MTELDISTVAGLRDALAFPPSTPLMVRVNGQPVDSCEFSLGLIYVHLDFKIDPPAPVAEIAMEPNPPADAIRAEQSAA